MVQVIAVGWLSAGTGKYVWLCPAEGAAYQGLRFAQKQITPFLKSFDNTLQIERPGSGSARRMLSTSPPASFGFAKATRQRWLLAKYA